MKQNLIFSALLLFTLTARSQDLSVFKNSPSILARNGIRRETVYEYFGPGKKADSVKTDEIIYDAAGNTLLEQNFIGAKLAGTTTYVYRKDKKLHQELMESYSPDDFWTREFAYDSAGNQVKAYRYNKDTSILIGERTVYNNRGQPIERYKQNFRDTFRLEEKDSYNEQGILIAIVGYNAQGPATTMTYELDSGGHYTKAWHQDLKDVKKKKEYIYNGAGQCVQVNGYAIQPTVYMSEDNSGPRKVETEVVPLTVSCEYHDDGTLFQVTAKTGKKITTIKRHYYSK